MNSFIHSGFHIVKPTILIQCPLFSGVSLFFQCSPHYNFPFVQYFLTIHYEMIVLYKWLIYFWACSLFCRINNFLRTSCLKIPVIYIRPLYYNFFQHILTILYSQYLQKDFVSKNNDDKRPLYGPLSTNSDVIINRPISIMAYM